VAEDIRLPLACPAVSTYQHHAYLTAVLAAGSHRAGPWLFHTYVNLFFLPGDICPLQYHLRFDPCPLLVTEVLSRERMDDTHLEFTAFVDACLESGALVIAYLNERYVPHRRSFGRRDFTHDVMICGRRPGADSYYLYGYDSDAILSITEIASGQLSAAFEKAVPFSYYSRLVRTWTVVEGASWHGEGWSGALVDLIAAKDSSAANPLLDLGAAWHGADIYAPLADWYQGSEVIDVRPVHILAEHARLMSHRAEMLAPEHPDIASYFKTRSATFEALCLQWLRLRVAPSQQTTTALRSRIARAIMTNADQTWWERLTEFEATRIDDYSLMLTGTRPNPWLSHQKIAGRTRLRR